jgi:hypothetical protein
MTKTVVEITGTGTTEEKSKFTVRVFSGAQNEDLIALIVRINHFKAWAEAKNMWNTPPSREVPQLYSEWRKCLTGLAEQNWLKIEERLVAPCTSKTFTLFKKCLSGFIVKKVAHHDDAYFMQKDYLNERNLTANMSFNE